MKRWVPKVGEYVTLSGNEAEGVEMWEGIVEKVSSLGCRSGRVRLFLKDKGWTTARRSEITIHEEKADKTQSEILTAQLKASLELEGE